MSPAAEATSPPGDSVVTRSHRSRPKRILPARLRNGGIVMRPAPARLFILHPTAPARRHAVARDDRPAPRAVPRGYPGAGSPGHEHDAGDEPGTADKRSGRQPVGCAAASRDRQGGCGWEWGLTPGICLSRRRDFDEVQRGPRRGRRRRRMHMRARHEAHRNMCADQPPDRRRPPGPGLDTDTLRELEQLIQRGHEILYACGWDGRSYGAFKPGGIEVLKFRARSLGLVRRACGDESIHYRKLERYAAERHAAEKGYHIREFLDVLEAVYRQGQRQRTFGLEPDPLLIETGADVIELAEALANAGCLVEACRHAGTVLARLLRRFARAHGVADVDERPLPELAAALRETGVVDDAAHRRLSACLQLSHDVWGPDAVRIPEGELSEMVQWVRDFALRHRRDGQRTS
jgi:hypothetical protein